VGLENCVLILDVDGTLIPLNIDFNELRERVRRLLNIDHPLKPLGESIASLPLSEELKNKAWEIIEEAELESIETLDPNTVRDNIYLIKGLEDQGVKIYLVTMRSRRTLAELLEKIGLSTLIDSSITRDMYPYRRKQLEYVKSLNPGKLLVFIGDTVYDQEASREVGVEFIRVQSHTELSRAVLVALNICMEMT
jgi:phosphoglycolate phosphatase-like HAD superfamily hydrolase